MEKLILTKSRFKSTIKSTYTFIRTYTIIRQVRVLGQETFDMRVVIYLMGNPDCKDLKKIYVGKLFLGYLKLGVLGAWMTFQKVEMAKTLRNGSSMIETNPLNHNWSDFAI